MTIEDIINKRLRPRNGTGNEWRLWEYKTLNMHRGVLLWTPTQPHIVWSEVGDNVRKQVASCYKQSWWRGFAFGALIEVEENPLNVDFLESCIDVRVNSKGTWQWLILACPEAKTALGMHTWTEGYLAPTYRGILADYESKDYFTGSFKKEKDALMKFLTTIARLKGVELPEFKP